MTFTKESLVNSIQNQLGFSKKKSIETCESVFDIMKKTLENGEDILISGFGKFRVRDKGQRRGRNPQTGSDMMMEARRVVVFKWSEILRNKIDTKG